MNISLHYDQDSRARQSGRIGPLKGRLCRLFEVTMVIMFSTCNPTFFMNTCLFMCVSVAGATPNIGVLERGSNRVRVVDFGGDSYRRVLYVMS